MASHIEDTKNHQHQKTTVSLMKVVRIATFIFQRNEYW